MEFSSIFILGSKHQDVCRCCLKKDGIEEFTTEYNDSGQSETYEKMLKDTFNIQIKQHDPEFSRMICERCIQCLQNADAFKQMVIQSEETFLKYLQSLTCDLETVDPDVKNDETKFEEPLETTTIFDISCGDDHDDDDDDEVLANLKPDVAVLNQRKRKQTHEGKTKSKRCKINETHKIESNENPLKKDWSKIAEHRGPGPLLRENSLKLIQNSTACVFQWNKSRYRCFCCKEPFSEINQLREHTYNSHTIENIERRIIQQQNRLVKVEISSLNCRLCQMKLEDLTTLKRHLSETHSMAIDEDLLVPFKIENEMQCQICLEKFTVFRSLNMHMNQHFQKQVCHVCGAGFSSLVFLNLHHTRSHGPFTCKYCAITFKSKTEKKTHDASVHGVEKERKRRFPCPFCPERFFQENLRVLHLIHNHGKSKPDFKCNVCSKNFLTRSLCNNHVKNVHNKEKNNECEVCHSFFYTKSDLARHKVTHTGEKKFSCDSCSSLFATRDSLRRHMKRIHLN